MWRRDPLRAGEVRDGAGDLEDAVVSAGGERELFHRLLQQVTERRVEGAVFLELRGGHAGIGGQFGAAEAGELRLPRLLDPPADRGRGFTGPVAPEFGNGQGGCLDVQVDAIEQWAAD